ncbi:MAG TPA: asparagine--tRNA ligase [Firmicutes bacterium]|nr:asparagine--tRNA ligase [Bacillota bacterium]
MEIKELNRDYKKYIGKTVEIAGWIKNHRTSSNVGFIDFGDGTTIKNVQLVYTKDTANFDEISHYRVGCALRVTGVVKESNGGKQSFEIEIKDVVLEGDCAEDYPIQPKRHTREFLRQEAYLRPRTNLFNAVFRIRSLAAGAIHTYFQERGYVYVHTPIITASDCEGAGEMFQVTTLDMDKIASSKEVDYSKDFFGKKAGLTVSGQLEGETFAMAFSKIYTFGPTFRAENSNTTSHLSEFWMIEPEIAFCDIDGLMDIEEDMLKYIIKYVLEHGHDEMEFLDEFVEKGLIAKLEKLINSKFTRITHHDVIKILKESKQKWQFEPEYGEDIAKEHEKYITEYFDGPVFITDWPKDIKAFYMKQNDDGKTVRAVDLEVPLAGELMGGSQREENYDKLVKRMHELGMDENEMDWYVNLRKYGTCTHSGFGMGFERLVMYLTGVENIRDVIPYPRTPNNCEY